MSNRLRLFPRWLRSLFKVSGDDRAAQIKRNRSEGARKAAATRKANKAARRYDELAAAGRLVDHEGNAI